MAPEFVEQLGVVVAGQHDDVGPAARQHGHDVGHRYPAVRRLGLERLHLDLKGREALELAHEVGAGLGATGRPSHAGADGHQPLHV